jgi:lipoprotein signal peptidase
VEWPVFNVADCCLVVGAGLLLIQAFRSQPAADEQPVAAGLTAEVAQVK